MSKDGENVQVGGSDKACERRKHYQLTNSVHFSDSYTTLAVELDTTR